jgi:hypothetical protein
MKVELGMGLETVMMVMVEIGVTNQQIINCQSTNQDIKVFIR